MLFAEGCHASKLLATSLAFIGAVILFLHLLWHGNQGDALRLDLASLRRELGKQFNSLPQLKSQSEWKQIL